MIVKIDIRETQLIEKINIFIKEKNITYIKIVIECLYIGDIIILDDFGKIYTILERKTINDLNSSIKDGRYEEQSYRLNELEIPNHNIIYLIEGKILKSFRINPTMIYSAIFSINYYKGFSVFRSIDINESIEIICNMANKINKNSLEKRMPYYKYITTNNVSNNNVSNNDNIVNTEINTTNIPYSSVIKKSKKSQITSENIGEIMLCQIPSISSTTAIAIMKEYKTLPNMIKDLEINPDKLKNITYINDKNQTKKLNKTNIENIYIYLNCKKINVAEKEKNDELIVNENNILSKPIKKKDKTKEINIIDKIDVELNII
jgi:ERCC4-type nuclease